MEPRPILIDRKITNSADNKSQCAIKAIMHSSVGLP